MHRAVISTKNPYISTLCIYNCKNFLYRSLWCEAHPVSWEVSNSQCTSWYLVSHQIQRSWEGARATMDGPTPPRPTVIPPHHAVVSAVPDLGYLQKKREEGGERSRGGFYWALWATLGCPQPASPSVSVSLSLSCSSSSLQLSYSPSIRALCLMGCLSSRIIFRTRAWTVICHLQYHLLTSFTKPRL